MKSSLNKRMFMILFVIFAFTFSSIIAGKITAWLYVVDEDSVSINNAQIGGGYFGGGNGQESSPYLIKTPKHFSNLSLLQFYGKITAKTYFRLENDINFSNSNWIVPVGTSENPFIGEFDGNGKILKNIKVTTDNTKINYSVNQGNPKTFDGIGVFGNVESGGVIKNFNISQAVIETSTLSSDQSYIGYICGVLNGSASNIGVYNSKMQSDKKIIQSDYGLIGQTTSGIKKYNINSGAITGGGSGNNFGSSIDIDNLYGNMTELLKDSAKASALNITKGSSSNDLGKPSSNVGSGYLPIIPINDADETKTSFDDYKNPDSSNIGYYVGELKVYGDKNFTVDEILYTHSIRLRTEFNSSNKVTINDGIRNYNNCFYGGITFIASRTATAVILVKNRSNGEGFIVKKVNSSDNGLDNITNTKVYETTIGDGGSGVTTNITPTTNNTGEYIFSHKNVVKIEVPVVEGQKYFIGGNSSCKSTYFYHLDIGASGGGSTSSSEVEFIDSVDFISEESTLVGGANYTHSYQTIKVEANTPSSKLVVLNVKRTNDILSYNTDATIASYVKPRYQTKTTKDDTLDLTLIT